VGEHIGVAAKTRAREQFHRDFYRMQKNFDLMRETGGGSERGSGRSKIRWVIG